MSSASFRRAAREQNKSTGIVRYSEDELDAMGPGKTDMARIAAMTDDELERHALEDGADDFDWSKAEIVVPSEKKAISIRLDPDVLAFFKEGGPGYQTRINAVLRSYMAQMRKTG